MLTIELTAFVLFCIHVSSLGLTWILMYGSILNPIRNWLTKWSFFRDLFRCAQCVGFWAGAFHLLCLMCVCIVYGGQWSNTLEQQLLRFVILTLPLQTSGVCYAFDHLIIGVAKGIGDMLYDKNNSLNSQCDGVTVIDQYAESTNTSTSNLSASHSQSAPEYVTTHN